MKTHEVPGSNINIYYFFYSPITITQSDTCISLRWKFLAGCTRRNMDPEPKYHKSTLIKKNTLIPLPSLLHELYRNRGTCSGVCATTAVRPRPAGRHDQVGKTRWTCVIRMCLRTRRGKFPREIQSLIISRANNDRDGGFFFVFIIIYLPYKSF